MMREYATPAGPVPPPKGNLTDVVVSHAQHHPDAVLFRRPPEGKDHDLATRIPLDEWREVTAAEFLTQVRAVAAGLSAHDIGRGDRVALMSRTRYEWTLLDYAIWYIGAVTVPIYETSVAEQANFVVAHSGAVAVITETQAHRSLIDTAHAGVDHHWTIDTDAVEALMDAGADVDAADLDARRAAVGTDDLATLLYTSGTTGPPKGCQLTHGNLLWEASATTHELAELFAPEGSSTLLFVPLAHVLARIVQIGCVHACVTVTHHHDSARLATVLAQAEPHFILGVPRVFEKLFNTASQRATAEGRGRAFDRAVQVAIAYSRAQDAGRIPVNLRAQFRVMDRLVYAKLREMLGGNCHYAIAGGAPLGERLGHFFRAIGVPVLEGYGLTETSGAVTTNVPDAHRIGTVGRPLPGVTARIALDGELLVRGDQITPGYWRSPEDTTELLDDDGWLYTGDIGEIDDEGFVRITGRKKEILVTAGGKNVSPTMLEQRLRSHPLISQSLVIGDSKPFIAALITIDQDQLAIWADDLGKNVDDVRIGSDADLWAVVRDAVDDANEAVSQAEAIRKFIILEQDWSEETGQLTPSLKVRRHVVLRDFSDEVAALYR